MLERLIDFSAPGPSVEERMAAGKALREKVPHESHAEYRPAPKRQDPVAILEEQAKTRLPVLVPIRYARMLASPFAFLRGSAAVMAADLAHTPVTGSGFRPAATCTSANFGVFASAERNLVFGINDFDETLPGAWEWDLKRLAASAVVAGRFMGGDKVCARRPLAPRSGATASACASTPRWGTWTSGTSRIGEQDILAALRRRRRARSRAIMAKARRRGHLQVLEKMAELVDDRHRIVEDKPLIVRETHTADGRPVAEVVDETMQVVPRFAPRAIAGRCSPAIGSSTWRARSSAWEASAPAAGSS